MMPNTADITRVITRIIVIVTIVLVLAIAVGTITVGSCIGLADLCSMTTRKPSLALKICLNHLNDGPRPLILGEERELLGNLAEFESHKSEAIGNK
jgi:hypothetical protein